MHDTHADEEKRMQPPPQHQQHQQQQSILSLPSPELARQLALHGFDSAAAPAAPTTPSRPLPPAGAPPLAFMLGGPAPGAPVDAAAAAAAPGSGGPPISPHRAGGRALYDASAPKYSSASQFEWTDDLAAQLTLQRMFADCIARIRGHNVNLDPTHRSSQTLRLHLITRPASQRANEHI